jgi:hypothetical protein
MVFDNAKFGELKKKYRVMYFKLDSVYCPVLKSRVKFNSDGFYHMLFKNSREKRTVNAQYGRLILIPLLKPVLRCAKRIHETRIEEIKVRSIPKVQTCHALIEYVGDDLDAKVKVVVRQIGNGSYYFHSAMKMNKNTRQTKTPPKGVSQ